MSAKRKKKEREESRAETEVEGRKRENIENGGERSIKKNDNAQ